MVSDLPPHDLRDFAHKEAYLLPFPNAMALEHIPDIEEHIDACKKGLIWLGFREEEINAYEDE